MSRKQTLLKGTFILTFTGLVTRFMGFFYRIFLSHSLGETGVGLYQLIFPVYALIFSLTSAGIELALSRCVSRYTALNNYKKTRELLYTSLIISLTLSCISLLLLQKHSTFIAENFLKNPDVSELLLLVSYSFPFASIHSCIVGYYLGMKLTKVPAYSQFIEQSFRILSVFVIFQLSRFYDFSFGISFAVLGLVVGEIASSLYCIKSVNWKIWFSVRSFLSCSNEIIRFSLPVTTSRVLLNLLQSVEAVLIPLSLQSYGLTSSDSLGIYGVLTGMALPFILFPSAITNAVSTMLLPTVSEIQALNDQKALIRIVKKTISSCTLMGMVCCISFLLFGNLVGNLVFKSKLAGKFIVTLAWMCPFLYSNNTLISIINGIGKTTISFLINASNLSIRILCVLFIIPSFGIYGYLIGLLISQLFVFLTSLFYLYRQFKAEVI